VLLLDENLSFRLVRRLGDAFPGIRQVKEVGLERAEDGAVWSWARAHDLAIVSKDDDFRQRAQYFGAPPEVVWLCAGNCATDDIERLLRARDGDIKAFLDEPETAILVLRR